MARRSLVSGSGDWSCILNKRILIHDFAGHPFQVQLSRELALREHEVIHVYCASLQTTPRGALTKTKDDPESLEIKGLNLKSSLEKFSFVTRWRQENEYGRLLAREVKRSRPDVVLSANTPLDAQRRLLAACRKCEGRFVFWVQDLIGIATKRLLSDRVPLLGPVIGEYYERLERRLLRNSDALILITEDFLPVMQAYGIKKMNLEVIENWAPLEEMPSLPQENEWAGAHGLQDKQCLLYSGTLGMKHNPQLLLDLALQFRNDDDVRIVVVSEGQGADWLRQRAEEHGLENLLLLDFQPYEELPQVLASADVLLAILEPDAGVFSVPSKVLTYHCAARPMLLAVPSENLAARIVKRNETGICVAPTDSPAFQEAARGLLENEPLRERLAQNARKYAETTFDLVGIADAFEEALLPQQTGQRAGVG